MRSLPTRRRAAGIGIAAALLAPLLTACGSSGEGVTLNFYNAPQENLQKVVDACNQAAGGKYTIVYNKLPRAADGQREQLVRRLAAEDDSMDILGLDVVWTAEFAGAGWIKEWTGPDKEEVESDLLPGPHETAMYEGKLYAAPANTNVQLLWYRADVVPTPPKTWDEMIAAAQKIKADNEGKPQDQQQPYRIGFTGSQYEGLVVGYNTLVASAGGQIINDKGTEAVMDKGAVEALDVLKTFATSGVTSPRLTNSVEDDVRLEMQDGNLAFELNWPYVYASMGSENPEMFKNFKWAPYPSVNPGEPARVTVGGANYAVSEYSQHPDEAFEATMCLRNRENQIAEAVNDGVPPTIESAYDDPQMAEAYPMKDDILAELKDSSTRPVTPAYQNVSTVVAAVLSPPSAIDPQSTADELKTQIQDALESKGVLP